MSIVFTLAMTYCVARTLPRLLVELIVSIVATIIVALSRRTHRALLHHARSRSSLDQPSVVARRLQRRSLGLALLLTDLTSLFPDILTRAECIVDAFEGCVTEPSRLASS